jgi:translation initiation factor IF-3
MDYGRFKFEALKREKDSRREHNVVRLKEMKLRPKISEHDFNTKYGYVRHFLADGDKVKLTIMFRGRELVHQEYGRRLLDRMAQELKDVAIVERMPLVEGRNMIMILSPLAKKHAKVVSEKGTGEPADQDDQDEPEQAQEPAAQQTAQVTAPQAADRSSNGSTSRNDAEDQNP